MAGGRYTTRRAYSRTPVRRVTRRSAVPRRPKTAFNTYALAHVDPFDDRCKGIKIPDANTIPSVAVTLSRESTMSMDTTFANAHVFLPTVGACEVTTALKNVGSNSWAWGVTPTAFTISAAQQVQHEKLAAFVNQFDLYRPVAHGIRLSCGLSPQTVTGFAHIAIVARSSLNRYTDDWWPKSVGLMSECQWYKRIPLATLTQRPMTVVNKTLDTTNQTYMSPNRGLIAEGTTYAADYTVASMPQSQLGYYDRDSLNGFAAIVVAVEGAPSGSSPLVIEQILHVEAIPGYTSLQVGSTAAPSRPDVLAGVSHMAATTPAEHFEGEEPSRISQAVNAFQQGVATAIGGTVDRVSSSVVNAAGHAGYAAATYAVNRAANAFGDVPGVGPANRLLH